MRVVASILSLALANIANALDDTGMWFVAPGAGHLWVDQNREVSDSNFYGAHFGTHFSERFSVEMTGWQGRYRGRARDLRMRIATIDGLRVFARQSRISPYVSAGAGYAWKRYSGDRRDQGPIVQVGVGVLVDVGESSSGSFVLQVRPSIGAQWDFFDRSFTDGALDYSARIALLLSFGNSHRRATSIAAH